MAEGRELKPKSFRIDNETADKFKEISIAIGGNQQETLAKLIEAFEFQSGKAVLTERKADIEQFEKYITAVTRMYMGVLEDNQNVAETVRTEFDALLKSKDITIRDLQKKLETANKYVKEADESAKQEVKEAREAAKHSEAEVKRLSAQIDRMARDYESRLEGMQAILDDKEKLNRVLADSHSAMEKKVFALQSVEKELISVSQELELLQQKYEQTLKSKESLEQQAEQQKAENEKIISELKKQETEALEKIKKEAKLQQDKAAFEIEKKYHGQLQILASERQAEIDKYQQKYFDLLKENNSYIKQISDLKVAKTAILEQPTA